MASSSADRAQVVVDPAHGGYLPLGGSTPGLRAGVHSGQLQKHVLLTAGQELTELLRARGTPAVITRAGDANLPLDRRAQVAHEHQADAFVSLDTRHAGAGPRVWVHARAHSDSVALGRSVRDALQRLGGSPVPLHAADAAVLRPELHGHGTAGCLVELGNLGQARDDRHLAHPHERNRTVSALARGVGAWLDARPPETAPTGHDADVYHEVPLVPQLTGMSCWAAAAAMLVGWRDCVDVDPAEVAAGSGHWSAYRDGLEPSNIGDLSRSWGLHAVHEPLTAASLTRLLHGWGPLWLGEASPGLHSIVVVGVHGDGTDQGTHVRVNDPWPIGSGERYSLPFARLKANVAAAAALVGSGPQVLRTVGRARPADPPVADTPTAPVGGARYGTPIGLFDSYQTGPAEGDLPRDAAPTGPRPEVVGVRTAHGLQSGVRLSGGRVVTARGPGPSVRVGSDWVTPTGVHNQGRLLLLTGLPEGAFATLGPAPVPRGLLLAGAWSEDGVKLQPLRARHRFSETFTLAEPPPASLLGAPVFDGDRAVGLLVDDEPGVGDGRLVAARLDALTDWIAEH